MTEHTAQIETVRSICFAGVRYSDFDTWLSMQTGSGFGGIS